VHLESECSVAPGGIIKCHAKNEINDRFHDARSAWAAPVAVVRVHDLKHTFGRRLRAAGVSFEDRQDLLGHKSQRITTHYSEAEVANLIAAAEKACQQKPHKAPAISWASGMAGAKIAANSLI